VEERRTATSSETGKGVALACCNRGACSLPACSACGAGVLSVSLRSSASSPWARWGAGCTARCLRGRLRRARRERDVPALLDASHCTTPASLPPLASSVGLLDSSRRADTPPGTTRALPRTAGFESSFVDVCLLPVQQEATLWQQPNFEAMSQQTTTRHTAPTAAPPYMSSCTIDKPSSSASSSVAGTGTSGDGESDGLTDAVGEELGVALGVGDVEARALGEGVGGRGRNDICASREMDANETVTEPTVVHMQRACELCRSTKVQLPADHEPLCA